jgi:hypothetical protein
MMAGKGSGHRVMFFPGLKDGKNQGNKDLAS